MTAPDPIPMLRSERAGDPHFAPLLACYLRTLCADHDALGAALAARDTEHVRQVAERLRRTAITHGFPTISAAAAAVEYAVARGEPLDRLTVRIRKLEQLLDAAGRCTDGASGAMG